MPMQAKSPMRTEIWSPDRLMPLGPGTPEEPLRPRLAELSLDALFAPAGVRRPELAQACLAGLWLWYDFLDESHRISQDLAGAEGSYWHALMHRREPDYSNSQYWFRRVGTHPVFAPLADAARKLAPGAPPAARFLTDQRSWDPFAFVALCEKAASEGGALEHLCRQVQKTEWELLFDQCWQRAVGEA
jgi:hypothetical protein